MADQGVTREELLAEIVALIEDKPKPPDGWFTAREVAEDSALPYEYIRKRLVALYKDGKINRDKFGLAYYYHK